MVPGALGGGHSEGEATTEALEAAQQAADTAMATGLLETVKACGEKALLEVSEAQTSELVDSATETPSEREPARSGTQAVG